MNTLFNTFLQEFKQETILNNLIYINISLFLLFSILQVFSFLFQFSITPIINNLYLPANNNLLITQPWTLITYMFLHSGLLHLLFNMAWLHFGGKIFLQYLQPKQLLSIYILGGISGGLLFILAFNYIPVLQELSLNAKALGASASVLAIIVAIATYVPNHTVHLPFIGHVKLKQIAIVCILLDILSIPNGNTGGHIAHLGGAIFGYIYIKQLTKSKNYSRSFNNIIEKIMKIFHTKNKLETIHKRKKSDYQFNYEKTKKQKNIDKILEKIAESGYESLSKQEKEILFSASKK